MEANLQAMVSQYAVVTFSTSIIEQEEKPEGDLSRIRLRVHENELSKLIEKNMRCRLEFPDKSSMKMKIREIVRENNDLFLVCGYTK
jgi:hypothetical protein